MSSVAFDLFEGWLGDVADDAGRLPPLGSASEPGVVGADGRRAPDGVGPEVVGEVTDAQPFLGAVGCVVLVGNRR